MQFLPADCTSAEESLRALAPFSTTHSHDMEHFPWFYHPQDSEGALVAVSRNCIHGKIELLKGAVVAANQVS